MGNGQKCDNDGECTSRYCKGSTTFGCLGTCTRRQREGEGCNSWTGNDAECVYKCTCGTCTNWRGKHPNGKACDWKSECNSNRCGHWWQAAVGCVGRCR